MGIAYPLPYTWLSLDRYAQVMGIAPMPFNTAIGLNTAGEYVFDAQGACDDFWFRHDWQDRDKVSHESLLLTIKQCEDDIMEAVGYPLCPTWIVEEVRTYPRYYRREMFGDGLDIRGGHKGMVLEYGKVIAGGQRALATAGPTVAIVPTYLDLDGDGFFETARVSFVTTLTDPMQIKVYFTDMDGDQEWEIRPCRSKTIVAGTFTADFYTWQFIDNDSREEYPAAGEGLSPIDISGDPPTNVVVEVDVYREYNDTTDTMAQFIWESSPNANIPCPCCTGTGCAACGLTFQDACFDVRNPAAGLVAPWPGTWDSDNSEWDVVSFSVCREPDMVKFWYYAGEYNQKFLKTKEFDPLSRQWQRIIARMATARLDRPLCSCGQLSAMVDDLQIDLAVNSGDVSRLISFDFMDNPFGTKKGEVEAWRFVSKLADKNLGGFAL